MYTRVELTKVLVRYKMSQALPPTGPTPYSRIVPPTTSKLAEINVGHFHQSFPVQECWPLGDR